MSPPEQSEEGPKHRACDECRARKLACTKEPDGCARCKREHEVCHYSLQRPMGRPRKRPRDEGNPAPARAKSAKSTKKASAKKPPTPKTTTPPDASKDPGLAFLSFLTGGDFDLEPTLSLDILDQPQQDKADWSFGYTGNDFAQLNFDATAEHVPSFSSSNIDPALFTFIPTTAVGATPPEGQVPALSSAQSSPPASSASPSNLGPTNCACIAGLYLSLDAMQKLSDEIAPAVRQARLAAKTAYQVINCPCYATPIDVNAPKAELARLERLGMHNFQIMMLLSTLIPSIATAYERILHMVDQEAAKARAERREVAFTLQNYGGTWGGLEGGCSTQALEHRQMDPTMWRLTMRALLRVDVYGISECTMGETSSSGDPFHLGLKDIVTQMENRSKERHAIIDPLIESGQWGDPHPVLRLHKTGEPPTCQKIIQLARQSIDNLVIA